MRTLVRAVGLVCVGIMAVPAAAQPAQGDDAQPVATPGDDVMSPDEAANKERASERFTRGVQLFQEGAYRAAMVEFRKAYELTPDYRVQYNIGQTHYLLGDYLSAIEAFEKYLLDGGSDVPPARVESVEDKLADLRERIGQLAIDVNLDGVRVFVDDKLVGRSPVAATYPVNLGQHRIYAESDAGLSDSKVVDVAGGEVKEVQLSIQRAAAPVVVQSESPDPRRLRPWAIAGLSVAVGAGAGAAVSGLMASRADDDLDGLLEEIPADPNAVQAKRDQTRRWALATDALMAASGAFVVTSVALFLVSRSEDDEDEQAEQARVHWGVGPTGVAVTGSF